MRTLLTAAALAALPLGAATAQQQVDLGRRTAADVSLRVTGAFTRLRVTGWDRDSVAITGTLPRGYRMDGGFVDALTGPSRAAKWYIEAPAGVPAGGTLELRVPRRARVWIKGNSAEVDATGITGELDLNVVGGRVNVSGDAQALNIEAMDAAVTVDGAPAWVRVRTSEGTITMRGGSPDAVFTSVSGDVRISDGVFERARIETVSGTVTFASDLARAASITIDSHSGPVTTLFGANASAEIDAVTHTATIENLLTRQGAVAGRERGQEIGLVLGTGDGRVVIRTFKAGIRLARRIDK